VKKILFLLASIIITALFTACSESGTTDLDPTNYETANINNQVWMKTNLNDSYYRNGDPIPQVTDSVQWMNLTTGAWCYYNNDPAMGAIYGKLYNWYAVNDPRGLAPEGWHIASNSEWTAMEDFLGGYLNAGGKLKTAGTVEAGTGLWRNHNAGATNESGFSALPGGYRTDYANFAYLEGNAYFWTSTANDGDKAWFRSLSYYTIIIIDYYKFKTMGMSVRCVRD